jgi:hypothetical protein
MRVEQLVDSRATLGAGDCEPEPEPEPSGLTPYATQLTALSYGLPDRVRLSDWISDSGESRIVVRPRRIEATIAKKAFENYANFSADERQYLEYAASLAMSTIGSTTPGHEAHVMVNYVPLLFTRDNIVQGYREWQGNSMLLRSDKLHDACQRHILIGGLATILYYADYPTALEAVE